MHEETDATKIKNERTPYLRVKLEPPPDCDEDNLLASFVHSQLNGLLKAVVLYNGTNEVDVTGFRLVDSNTIYSLEDNS